LDEIWLPSRLRCCELKSIVCFPIVAIYNPKWPPKYKNTPIWTKFGFQVDYDVANWYPSLVCYGGHFVSKMATKIKNPPIGMKFGFQVDYDVANWYPSLVCYGSHLESKMAAKIQKSSDLDEIWLPSRLRCCELISIVGLLRWPFYI